MNLSPVWLRRGAGTLFALSLLAFLLVGANGPANSHLACAGRPGANGLAGFRETAFTVQPPPPPPPTTTTTLRRRRTTTTKPVPTTVPPKPAPLQLCALLAATESLRERGLTGRVDLGGYDAMLFRFPADTDTPFHNKGVPISLSVAWFSAEGLLVGTADMAPCAAVTTCPRAVSPSKYRFALEVPKGGLGAVGVAPGTRVTLPT